MLGERHACRAGQDEVLPGVPEGELQSYAHRTGTKIKRQVIIFFSRQKIMFQINARVLPEDIVLKGFKIPAHTLMLFPYEVIHRQGGLLAFL